MHLLIYKDDNDGFILAQWGKVPGKHLHRLHHQLDNHIKDVGTGCYIKHWMANKTSLDMSSGHAEVDSLQNAFSK